MSPLLYPLTEGLYWGGKEFELLALNFEVGINWNLAADDG